MLRCSWSRFVSSLSLVLLVASCSLVPGTAAEKAPAAELARAVSGRVFLDANSNGKLDADEKGFGGVRVSNGADIVRTSRDGAFTLRVATNFVFVVVPSGYRASDGYYRPTPKDGPDRVPDFALAPSKDSANRKFSFAQVTDIHVQNDPRGAIDDLKEIAAFKPSFIMAAGDMVNDGRKIEQLQTYKGAIDGSAVPVINVPGNHDAAGDPANYESVLGVLYFSFDYGGCHFVVLNCVQYTDVQKQWLTKDLQQSGAVPVLVFHHYHPSTELMRQLAQYNTIAIFSGHWHTTKVFPYEFERKPGVKSSILYVNSPPLTFGGIDVSPRGFVLASVNNGRLTIEHRHGGVNKHFAIAAPAEGAQIASGPADIRIAAYDSSSPTVKVEYQLDNGPWRAMPRSGVLSYSARERLAAGSHTLTARCRFGETDPVEKNVHFTVSPSMPAAPKSGDPWPTLQHDPARTGLSADVVTPPLKLAWMKQVGGTAHGAAPVVVGDTVYLGIADEDCAGKAGVYALDARSGAILWRYPTKGSVRNAVAVVDGSVYALSVAGEVVALDAATGQPRFTKQMSGVDRWLFSSPVVSDGVLYTGSGADFRAFDAQTGERIWLTEAMGGDWISCLTSPAVDKGRVLMGLNWNKGIYALNRRTSKAVWNGNKGYGTSHCTPTIAGDRVYHAAENKLHCMDSASGKEIWSFDLPGSWTLSSPAVKDGRVVVGGPDGNVYCVDAATGKKLWNTSTSSEIMFFAPYGRTGHPVMASPAISGNVAYIGGVDGKFYALDINDGKALWSYDVGVPITASAAISGNAVYVTTYDGAVYAFTASK